MGIYNNHMEKSMEELKRKNVWVCWNYTEKDGKKTKVPFSALGGPTGTSSKYSGTWTTYDRAAQCAIANKYSGVGFIVEEGRFFIDIDHRTTDDPFARQMISRFGNTYIEYSPSGEGIHIHGICDLSKIPSITDSKGNKKLSDIYYIKTERLEVYIGGFTNRYSTFTGNAITDMPLSDCTGELLETLDEYMVKPSYSDREGEKSSEENDFRASRLPAAEVKGETVNRYLKDLRKTAGIGKKFKALFDEGDTSAYGNDDSAADLALCYLLAYRVGNDPELIDRLFRMSKLCREKWENRADYRDNTIRKAIASASKFHYDPMHRVEEIEKLPEFVMVDQKTHKLKVHSAALAAYVKQNCTYIMVHNKGEKTNIVYVYENGVYKIYSDNEFKALIKGFVEEFDPMLVTMGQIDEAFKNLITVRDVVGFDELDSDYHIINFENGILNLDTMKLEPHSPKYYSTVRIPCNWTEEDADTPVFDRYIQTLTNCHRGLHKLLLQFLGFTISNIPGYYPKQALFLIGDGNTGKSQFFRLLHKILGQDIVCPMSLEEMEERFGKANLLGRRLAGKGEMKYTRIRELVMFKMLTDGDPLSAEIKGKMHFNFIYNGTMLYCMNRFPKFGGDQGHWVYDRILPVECVNVIPKEERDPELLNKLYAEREGIVRKAVLALPEVINNKYHFTEPQIVTEAREKYRNQNISAVYFWISCMTKRPYPGKIEDKSSMSKVLDVYRKWCRDNGEYASSDKEFRECISEYLGKPYGELIKKLHGISYFSDYTLSIETKNTYRAVYGVDSLCDAE